MRVQAFPNSVSLGFILTVIGASAAIHTACSSEGGGRTIDVGSGGNGGSGATGGSHSSGTGGGGIIIPNAGSDSGGAEPEPCTGPKEVCDVPFCGDGRQNQDSEACDDGNDADGDGCSATCDVEANWVCPTPGSPCVSSASCGDGKLIGAKECDDGNKVAGDGCSASCKLEAGWECRQPGQRCVPLCGDGKVTATETCDLGATVSDGCVNCQTAPGYTCTATACTKSVCGDGKVETGEVCDAGAANGLFNGDGTGCSKTCTPEPTCRDAAGKNQACTATCGDGNVDVGEGCDDGNRLAGDGCAADCSVEDGFTCAAQPNSDSTACAADPTKKCLTLPVVYRDFKSSKYAGSGAHPDFLYMGTNYVGTSTPIYCIPNGAGTARQSLGGGGDATARCANLATTTLVNGKPVYNSARAGGNKCDCQFTDWSRGEGQMPNGGSDYVSPLQPLINNAGLIPAGASLTYNGYGKPVFKGSVQIVKDATSFSQWYTDVPCSGGAPCNRKSTGTLALQETAPGSNQFRYSSGNDVINSGFFPIDGTNPTAAPWSEPLLCNLWPYWYFDGKTCTANQYLFPPSVASEGWKSNVAGKPHNAYFTSEARYLFVYNNPLTLKFYGDDDLFIYINGILALDLGGIHQQLPGQVDLADPNTAGVGTGRVREAGNPNLTTGDVTTAERDVTVDFKLEKGKTYEIAIFNADRGPRESNYQLTLSGFTTNRSFCTPRCGDAVATGAEECDLGDGVNNDTTYGGCTTACKWGPFCGDGDQQGEEQCDDGKNQTGYGTSGCAPGCRKPGVCGDGAIDTLYGEQCDDGAKNSDSVYGACSTKCKRGARCGDGVVQAASGEQCDNGKNRPGSGCNPMCQIEIIR